MTVLAAKELKHIIMAQLKNIESTDNVSYSES